MRNNSVLILRDICLNGCHSYDRGMYCLFIMYHREERIKEKERLCVAKRKSAKQRDGERYLVSVVKRDRNKVNDKRERERDRQRECGKEKEKELKRKSEKEKETDRESVAKRK